MNIGNGQVQLSLMPLKVLPLANNHYFRNMLMKHADIRVKDSLLSTFFLIIFIILCIRQTKSYEILVYSSIAQVFIAVILRPFCLVIKSLEYFVLEF